MRSRLRLFHLLPLTALALATAVLLAGCEEPDEVRVYTVAKAERPPAHLPQPSTRPAMESLMPRSGRAAMDAAAGGAVSWVVPEGWRQAEEEQPLRAATFTAGEGANVIEIAVSQFPGDVGGLLANVNRWRGQVGLGPMSESELDSIVTHFNTPGFHGHTMRIEGAEQHMLAAELYESAADRTWFVKATAAPGIADVHEADVFAFARSFGTTSATTAPVTTAPAARVQAEELE